MKTFDIESGRVSLPGVGQPEYSNIVTLVSMCLSPRAQKQTLPNMYHQMRAQHNHTVRQSQAFYYYKFNVCEFGSINLQHLF